MKLWTQVTRRSPCQICGGKSWCALSADGRVRRCMRNLWAEGAQRTTSKKDGSESALYFDDAMSGAPYTPPVETGPALASVETLDTVYRAMLKMLSLSDEHRQSLRERGLTDEQIDNEGFRTLGPGANAGLKLAMANLFPAELLATVPGFFVTKYLGFEPVAGICIPVRDERGRIVAIKVRRQNATDRKYGYLTSKRHDGPSPGSPAHVPLLGNRGTRVRITEGEFKATVCSALTDTFTISAPGVSQLHPCLAILKELGATHVVLAWDREVTQDYGLFDAGPDNGRNVRFGLHPKQKPNHVASSLDHAMHLLESEGYTVSLEQWPEDAGKGIDDVLAAGLGDRITEYTGTEAWDRVIDNLSLAKTLPREDTKAKCSPEALARSWPRERTADELDEAAEDQIIAGGCAAPEDGAAPSLGVGPEGADGGAEGAAYASLDDVLMGALDVKVPKPKSSGGKDKGGPPGPPKKPKPERRPPPPTDFDRGDEVELSKRLLEDLRGDSPEPVLCDRGQFWRFEPESGLWREIPMVTAYHRIVEYAGMLHQNKDGESVPLNLSAAKIKGALWIAQNLGKAEVLKRESSGMFFDRAPRGIATNDRFIRLLDDGDIVTETLGAEHRQTVCLPFAWNPEATCPKWERFYETIFADCSPEEATRRVQALDEIIGVSLFGIATRYQKCILLLGAGSNGKGTWMDVMLRLFPEEFVCSMTPKDMNASRFAMSFMAGKRLNMVGELPSEKMFDTSKCKAVIAGDKCMAEPKNAQAYMMRPEAGHCWSGNGLPKTADTSHGFFRRFLIVHFNMKFETGEAGRVKGLEITPNLAEELATELPGIFVRVVAAVQRLVRRKCFIAPMSSVEAVHAWKSASDSVTAFFDACCVEDKNAITPLAAIYEAYQHWARQTGNERGMLPSNLLGAKLSEDGYYHRSNTARGYRIALLERGAAGSLVGRQGVPPSTAH